MKIIADAEQLSQLQAITWANVDQVLEGHISLIGHNP